MAVKEIKAGDEFALRLSKLASGMEEIAGKAVYAGAKVAADTLRDEIEALPEVDERSTTQRGVSKAEKADLLKGLGVSHAENARGSINVKTGFNDYGHPTKTHPQGVPVVLTARAIQSGTSFRLPNRFNTRATSKAKPLAEAEMARVVKEEIRKTKG